MVMDFERDREKILKNVLLKKIVSIKFKILKFFYEWIMNFIVNGCIDFVIFFKF